MAKFHSFRSIGYTVAAGVPANILAAIVAEAAEKKWQIWGYIVLFAISFVVAVFIDKWKSNNDSKKNKEIVDESKACGRVITYDGLSNMIHIGERAYHPDKIPFLRNNKDYKSLRKKYDNAKTDEEKSEICLDIDVCIQNIVRKAEEIYDLQEKAPNSKEINQIKDEFDEGNLSKVKELVMQLKEAIKKSDDLNGIDIDSLFETFYAFNNQSSEENSYTKRKESYDKKIIDCKLKLADIYYEYGLEARNNFETDVAIKKFSDSKQINLSLNEEFGKVSTTILKVIQALSISYLDNNYLENAKDELLFLLQILELMNSKNIKDIDFLSLKAECQYDLACTYDKLREFDDAVNEFYASISTYEKIKHDNFSKYAEVQHGRARSFCALGSTFENMEEFRKSGNAHKEALIILEELIKEDCDNCIYLIIYAKALIGMALANRKNGNRLEANRNYSEALKISRKMYDSNKIKYSSILSFCLYRAAQFHGEDCDWKVARKEYEESISLEKEMYDREQIPNAFNYATHLYGASVYYCENEDYYESLDTCFKAYEVCDSAISFNETLELEELKVDISKLVGLIYLHLNDDKNAESYYIDALDTAKKIAPKYGQKYNYITQVSQVLNCLIYI